MVAERYWCRRQLRRIMMIIGFSKPPLRLIICCHQHCILTLRLWQIAIDSMNVIVANIECFISLYRLSRTIIIYHARLLTESKTAFISLLSYRPTASCRAMSSQDDYEDAARSFTFSFSSPAYDGRRLSPDTNMVSLPLVALVVTRRDAITAGEISAICLISLHFYIINIAVGYWSIAEHYC